MLLLQPQQHGVVAQGTPKATALGLNVRNRVAVHDHLKHADFIAWTRVR